MGYKIFHFSIKITPLDFFRKSDSITTARWSSPKYKNHMYKKIHSQYFPKSNYNHKDLWSSSKYKIKINSTKFHRNLFFSKPCMHILQKIFTYTKCHILTFYYFYFTPYLIYNHNIASRTEDLGKVFGLQHLHLKNYFKIEKCEPNGLNEYYKF